MRYEKHMRSFLLPLVVSRIIPYCGIAFLLALAAHNLASDVALIAYILAFFSVLSVMVSMPLAGIGNLIAEHSEDPDDKKKLFSGGLGAALTMAAMAILFSCLLLAIILLLPGAQMDVNKVYTLALIYSAAVPLLVINTFLHFFHEASGDARACSIIKAGTTLVACIGIFFVYSVSESNINAFVYWAMGYFLFGEVLLLVCLMGLSWRRALSFVPVYCKRTACNIKCIGLPIALGLGGQKLYFYLLNEKLAAVASALVAQLSIYMSVVGLLMIPVVAYCQAHSLYVSKYVSQCPRSYVKGQAGLLCVVVIMLCVLLLGGSSLFFWLGGQIIIFDREAIITVTALLVSSAVLSLSAAHLRGLRDTLAPQLVMNVLMLSVLVPIIYFAGVGYNNIHFYLRLQSAGLFTGFVVLQLRIRYMHGNAVMRATVS